MWTKDYISLWLHFIKIARLKSIRSSELYVSLTAKPNNFSLLEYLYSAFFFFLYNLKSSNKAVQQVVPLNATHINDKALIIIGKNYIAM